MMGYGTVKADMVYGFASLHPRLCFIYFAGLITICMLVKHPVYLGAAFLVTILLNFSIDRGRSLRKGLVRYLLIALVIFITNPLFSSRGATILFYLLDRPVTLESIVYGAIFAISLLSVLFAFVAFNLIITPEKMLYLITPFAPRTAFIVTVTLRFVPLLTSRLKEIMTIKRIMGQGKEQSQQMKKSKKNRMQNGMESLHTLISWSLEEALITASSMRARGYGVTKRSSARIYKMDNRDRIVMWIIILTGTNLIIGAWYGVNRYDIYPRLSQMTWTSLYSFHFTCFLLYLLFPLFMNGKEWLHWYLIRSKM
ncbi:energy-coupling factor transporter transmembrane component T [Paenibacillus sp. Marseille-Q4541]|uniref:energy-coupling factor transporter transmembrane component T n=1 Tax=Paenibacillus sp. Marseille-Q4541 TaxID=2831522 RepID=UPI001BAB688A|nr:energy-coupling factor transporter transmembrane component T [Paenibacillus sp. Marseille-Q4541]